MDFYKTLGALYKEVQNDDMYGESELDREEGFIYLALRDVHKEVKENLSENEAKSIVYANDVLSVMKRWETQSQRAIHDYYDTVSYHDLALVPIVDKLLEIIEKEYKIYCITKDIDNRYRFVHKEDSPLFRWTKIYCKNFC